GGGAGRPAGDARGRWASHNTHTHTPMISPPLPGGREKHPNGDNAARPPQRTDFPHLGAVLARFKRPPPGLPGYIALPEVAVRSSIQGEFRRARTPLRGGGGGFLGPLGDPPAVPGQPPTAPA